MRIPTPGTQVGRGWGTAPSSLSAWGGAERLREPDRLVQKRASKSDCCLHGMLCTRTQPPSVLPLRAGRLPHAEARTGAHRVERSEQGPQGWVSPAEPPRLLHSTRPSPPRVSLRPWKELTVQTGKMITNFSFYPI